MATFAYVARKHGGERTEGVLEAPNRQAALAELERGGWVPVSIAERRGAAGGSPAARRGASQSAAKGATRQSGRMSMRDVLLLTTELSDLLSSGMTLGNALNCLANRKTGRASDQIVAGLRDDIVQGTSLSDALAKYPRSFSTLYSSMIRAGEASGALDEVLRRLVVHYERIQEVKDKVIMALVYPAIVIVMGIATLIFSMIYVVPKFSMVFAQLGQALPLPTRMLIAGSNGIVRYGWLAAIVGTIAVVLLNRAVATPAGRLRWHAMLLKMPLLRGVVASSVYAGFARTLGTLLNNGVPVLQALAIVEQTVGNAVIGRELRKARDRVTDGTTISGPLAAGRVFPPIMTDMLAVGEQTGDMAGALSHIARRYESELDRNVKILTTALEPILIVLVAVMVGFVAISVLMAVFDLTSGLNV